MTSATFEGTIIKAEATPEWAFGKGVIHGFKQGLKYSKATIARASLAEGLSIDTIRKITGLDEEIIRGLER